MIVQSVITQRIHHSVNLEIQWVVQRHQIGKIRLVNKKNEKGQYPEEKTIEEHICFRRERRYTRKQYEISKNG